MKITKDTKSFGVLKELLILLILLLWSSSIILVVHGSSSTAESSSNNVIPAAGAAADDPYPFSPVAIDRLHFPANFFFGTATAAYQVEGAHNRS
ncbi:family 1 glycosylhydrolase, partial [Klebsiella pneumoniae]|uniref:family 1 glycosylhydrolase n=1 Tax=Klebsiella pneumoniae TaxID=573 RepID=UPI00132F7BD6